jgi:vesicle-associated membrane protein 7
MAILYAVVARGTVVLAEFSAVTGNTGAVARRILEKLPAEADSRLCFSQDSYIFHILRSDGLAFLCMANNTFGSAYSFISHFLSTIHLFIFEVSVSYVETEFFYYSI